MYLIGIDEAGYAPNLGPLVIGGSLWQVPDSDPDLYECLANSVSPNLSGGRITICDSKQLHQANHDLQRLEQNLFPLLFEQSTSSDFSWQSLLDFLIDIEFPKADEFESQLGLWNSEAAIRVGREQVKESFFVVNKPLAVPTAADLSTVNELRERFHENCRSTKVKLIGIRGVCLMPNEFNELVTTFGNKSTVLSIASLLLADSLLGDATDKSAVKILCDKHGGRNRYRFLLERVLNAHGIQTLVESTADSIYTFSRNKNPVEIRFTAHGEGQLPTALSSMFAKYFREIVMTFWNRYWTDEIEGLAPTKGYPVDAARFFAEIKPHLTTKRIPEATVWRSR